jgi:hypothetical protein
MTERKRGNNIYGKQETYKETGVHGTTERQRSGKEQNLCRLHST